MGAVVDFLLAGFTDNSGNPLNGGKVYAYAAGTDTPKDTYTDNLNATPSTNPIILDSNGRKQVYADGAYKFVIKTALDATLYTFDNLFFASGLDLIFLGTTAGATTSYTATPSPAQSSYVDGRIYSFQADRMNIGGTTTLNISAIGAKTISTVAGEIQSGVTYLARWSASADRFYLINASKSYATTQAELAALNTAAVEIFVKTAITMTGNLTLTAPITFEKGGSIVTTSYTLTVSGPFDADAAQVFSGSGSVVFGNKTYAILPEWFGALGDNSTDDTTALQQAINSGATNYVPIKLKQLKIYKASQLTIPTRSTLYSDGYWNTGAYIAGTAANPLIVLPTGADSYIKMKGILLDGRSTSTSCLKVDGASYNQFEDCVFLGSAIGVDHSGGGILNNFLRCKFTGAMATGFKVSGISNHVILTACRFQCSSNTNDIVCDSSWSGDSLFIRDSTFESAGSANAISIAHTLGTPAQHAIIEGNRFDAAHSNSLIYIFEECRVTVCRNNFASTVPWVVVCDGDFCTIENNYISGSTTAGVRLLVNSAFCYVGPNNSGGIAPFLDDGGSANSNMYWMRGFQGPPTYTGASFKGNTAGRPTLAANHYGFMYMDTTLDADGKPIWWNGTIWVDATGASV